MENQLKETGRIESFSDGVFSIAITLLALELKVPAGEEVNTNTALWEYFKGEWPGYLAFFISFFSILTLWVNHHLIFEKIYKVNGEVMFANGLMLFLVAAVNFPTQLLAQHFNAAGANMAMAIYSGLFVLINISYNLLWYAASKDKHLLKKEVTENTVKTMRTNYLIGLPLYVSAFIVSFISPPLSLAICCLLWIFWSFITRINNR